MRLLPFRRRTSHLPTSGRARRRPNHRPGPAPATRAAGVFFGGRPARLNCEAIQGVGRSRALMRDLEPMVRSGRRRIFAAAERACVTDARRATSTRRRTSRESCPPVAAGADTVAANRDNRSGMRRLRRPRCDPGRKGRQGDLRVTEETESDRLLGAAQHERALAVRAQRTIRRPEAQSARRAGDDRHAHRRRRGARSGAGGGKRSRSSLVIERMTRLPLASWRSTSSSCSLRRSSCRSRCVFIRSPADASPCTASTRRR